MIVQNEVVTLVLVLLTVQNTIMVVTSGSNGVTESENIKQMFLCDQQYS